MTLLPMLAHPAPLGFDGMPLMPPADEWSMEPKCDGWRFLFEIQTNQVIAYAGRNGNPDYSHSPALRSAMANMMGCLPPNTILDTEVTVNGGSSPDVSTALANGSPVTVWVFDVRQIDSMACEELTFDRRRSLLEMMQFDPTGNVKLIPNFEPSTENLNAMLSQGYEGIMLKRWSGRYRAGHRSRDVLKWKPQPTAEAIITGFKEGEGGRAGNVGALLIRMVDGDVDTSVGCPPFLAAQLQNGKPFNQCQDLLAEWVGKHIEFAHNGIQKTGGPRHPVFRKLRPDRDAVENAWGIR